MYNYRTTPYFAIDEKILKVDVVCSLNEKITSLYTTGISITVVHLHLGKRMSFVLKIKRHLVSNIKHDMKSTHEQNVEKCQRRRCEIISVCINM